LGIKKYEWKKIRCPYIFLATCLNHVFDDFKIFLEPFSKFGEFFLSQNHGDEFEL